MKPAQVELAVAQPAVLPAVSQADWGSLNPSKTQVGERLFQCNSQSFQEKVKGVA
jgi:hypothetical protein